MTQSLRKHKINILKAVHIVRTGLSKAGVDRSYVKVFAIGFNKTATTSIDTLFGKLGYQARYHGTAWRPEKAHRVHWQWQAFSDGKPDNFKRLDQIYPRARFILNTRDPLEWLDSRYQHVILEKKLGRVPKMFIGNPRPKLSRLGSCVGIHIT